MDCKKWLRVAVCLLLLLCFLVNVSPIKAKAVDPVTITAAAILGATVLGLSAYCGFVLAPPDVDFVEDVGEEFNDFVQVVINTGGMPDDDDDDTNNPFDDLVDQITSSTQTHIQQYTDAVGDALKGNTTFYDAAVFGGFAGTMPAFKLFLKWMIANGYLDRTVDVPAADGWTYYGEYYYPTFPEIDGYPNMYLTSSAGGYYLTYTAAELIYSPGMHRYQLPTSSENYYQINLSAYDFDSWDSHSSYSIPDTPVSDFTPPFLTNMCWSNIDILTNGTPASLKFAGSEPSVTAPELERVEPTFILGPISGAIVDGLEANGIPLPEKFNYVKIFDGASTGGLDSIYESLNKIVQSLDDGSKTLEDLQNDLTYKEPDSPEESEPTAPSVSPDPTTPSENIPFDGSLGNTPVGDFFTNLGNLIMSPFEWIWNKIEAFFDPWINSIGDWFSQVRGDLQAIPGKFQKWFTDIIDGITNLPGKFEQWFVDLIDGIKNLPNKVAEAFQKLLFPSDDYLTDKVDQLTGQFVFADSIVKTGQALHLGLAGVTTEPPVIYIDLGAARGFHDIGGRVPFLDLRWYAEYKPTVDTIISAFLWICFVWRMLIKLPGIISGMPGDFVMTGAHAMGLDDMLPSRKKEYEIQRIDNRQTIRKGRGL